MGKTETLIPEMDYIVATRISRSMYINECIMSIAKQSNVHRIILLRKEDFDTGHFFLKVLGAKMATTEYIVIVDDDVHLRDQWIEKVWPYIRNDAAVFGFVYLNENHYNLHRLRKRNVVNADKWMARLQNTVVKRTWLANFAVKHLYGIDAGTYFGDYLAKHGKRMLLAPIFSKHVSNHVAKPFREGVRGGSKRRFMGMLRPLEFFTYVTRLFLGGLKMAFQFRTIWYLKHATLQTLGFIYGYFKCIRCLEAYDFG